MKYLGPLILIGVLFLVIHHAVIPAYATLPLRTAEGIVLKVSEGDCIIVNSNGTDIKTRLYGIDAPETQKLDSINGGVKRGQAFGDAAFRALAHKVLHKRVRLEVLGTDRHRQEVCIVWLESRNINLEMVAEGWAWSYQKHLGSLDASEYRDAEKRAHARKLGLWVQKNPQPPWEFRKMLKRGKSHEE